LTFTARRPAVWRYDWIIFGLTVQAANSLFDRSISALAGPGRHGSIASENGQTRDATFA
jgi:hypothetical protein